jgi:hypothetical protein
MFCLFRWYRVCHRWTKASDRCITGHGLIGIYPRTRNLRVRNRPQREMELRKRIRRDETSETGQDECGESPMSHEAPSTLAAFQSQITFPLSPAELEWASLQPYLKSQGYILRPRYNPEFIPKLSKDEELSNLYGFHVSTTFLPSSSFGPLS